MREGDHVGVDAGAQLGRQGLGAGKPEDQRDLSVASLKVDAELSEDLGERRGAEHHQLVGRIAPAAARKAEQPGQQKSPEATDR